METIGLGGRLVFDEKQAVKSMGRASGAFGKLQKGARRVGAAFSGFATAARNAGLAAAAVGAGLAFALKDAREFGKAVGEVSTIADEAEFPMERIRKLSKELGVQYGVMPVEQAKAMYQAISAGATTAAEATDLMHTANMLAIGGVSDSFTAMDVLTTATNSYAAAGLEAADASDVIFTAVRLGKTTVDELGASLGQVIPAAADLNVSFEELGAAMATITVGGISTAEASTALNAALMGIRKPSEQAKKAAKRLGIDFSATALKTKDLVTVLSEAAEAAKGDDEAITALFGSVRALKAISVLTANEGRKFNESLAAMEGRAGATEEAFDKMSKTTDFQLNRMNALRKASMTTLGEILEPLAIRVLTPLGRMAEKLFDILEAVRSKDFEKLGGRAEEIAKGIRAGVDSISESMTTLRGHFDKFSEALGAAFGAKSVENIAKVATKFILITALVSPLILALSALALFVSSVLIPVFTGLGIATTAAFWPIAIVVGIVALGIYALGEDAWALLSVFIEVLGGIWTQIKDTFGAAWNFVSTIMGGMFDAFMRLVSGDVLGAFSTLKATINEALMIPITFVLRGIIRLIDFLTIAGKAEWVPAGLREFAKAPAPKVPRQIKGIERAEFRGFGEAAAAEAAAGRRKRREVELLLPGVTPGVAGLARHLTPEQQAIVEMRQATENAMKSAEAAQKASEAAEKAAKEKPKIGVNVDGREVARASAKHEEEVKARSGFRATPWQRTSPAIHGVST